MALKHVNAVVIGSGAGGGVVAKELATNGFSVVLLESGKFYTPADCRKDDLRNQFVWPLGIPFGPDEKRSPRVIVDPNGREQIVRPSDGGYQINANCVGGGTLSFGAQAWRYMEADFRMRSTYGEVKGSTLDDWPITYNDLEPYYEKAEWEIGVSGDVSTDPYHGPRRRSLPMPPLPPTRQFQVLEAGAKRKGLHPFHIPMLRNSVPYNGRPACMRCRWCLGFACEVSAKCGTQNTVIPIALASGNCELRTRCLAKEVITDTQGKATGVAYFDADDRLQTQTADLVVVSCGAIESARLLLNSKSRLFPNGLGNRYDWVGRNLQGNTYVNAYGLFDYDIYDDLGPGSSIGICDYNHGNPGLVGGAVLTDMFLCLPYSFATRSLPPKVPRWGKAHKDYMRRAYRRVINVTGSTQQMPLADSRVQLDPKVKDYWGVPVPRISGDCHPHTTEVARAMVAKAEVWLKEAGAIETWTVKVAEHGLRAGQHQAGTCRMGNDPKTSVVDKFCRVHDIDNLYVIDGSVHVTNGGFCPALTIMAIGYYASENLLKVHRRSA